MTDIWMLLVGQAAWQTVLVAGVVLALVRVGRRWPAGIRHGLLAVALLKFLTPPFLAAPTGLLAALAAPVTLIDHSPVGPSKPAEWLSILAALHLTGAVAMICLVLAAWVRSRLWVRRGSPAPAEAAQVCETVGKRLGMQRHVGLLLSTDAPSPLAAGALKPVILLPEPLLDALDAQQLEAVITHELVHHRNRDLWWSWLRAVACALWWWNPAVWMVSRALRAVQEEACDDAVVSTGVMDRGAYCETLLRIATVDRSPLVGSLAFALRVHPLGRRVRRLLDGSAGARTNPAVRWASAAIAAAILLPGVPLESSTPVPDVPNPRETRLARMPEPEDLPIVGSVFGVTEALDRLADQITVAAEQWLESRPARNAMRQVRNTSRGWWRSFGREVKSRPSPSPSPSPSSSR